MVIDMIGAKLRIIHENSKKTEKKIPKVWYYSKNVVPLPSSNVSINSSNNLKLIRIMAYVIGEDCISCGTCAGECPVEAISEGAERYVIDADACTECGTCASVCPSEAISLP